jgi:cytochrome b pre-mRNA-processing protein 3
MILRLFRRTRPDPSIAALYGAIVAQARNKVFYRNYGVADTVDGRFEMIVLHLALLLRRLDREAAAGRALGQGVFDWFCQDMDANLREMGTGDLGVPRKMRAIGEAFYGRRQVYDSILTSAVRPDLVEPLVRNVFGGEAVPGAAALADYVWQVDAALARQDGVALLGGALTFPKPADSTTISDP